MGETRGIQLVTICNHTTMPLNPTQWNFDISTVEKWTKYCSQLGSHCPFPTSSCVRCQGSAQWIHSHKGTTTKVMSIIHPPLEMNDIASSPMWQCVNFCTWRYVNLPRLLYHFKASFYSSGNSHGERAFPSSPWPFKVISLVSKAKEGWSWNWLNFVYYSLMFVPVACSFWCYFP